MRASRAGAGSCSFSRVSLCNGGGGAPTCIGVSVAATAGTGSSSALSACESHAESGALCAPSGHEGDQPRMGPPQTSCPFRARKVDYARRSACCRKPAVGLDALHGFEPVLLTGVAERGLARSDPLSKAIGGGAHGWEQRLLSGVAPASGESRKGQAREGRCED